MDTTLLEYSDLIDQAATLVEQRVGVQVLPSAKRALLDRLSEHAEAASAAMNSGDLTADDFRNAAIAQLNEAVTVVRMRSLTLPFASSGAAGFGMVLGTLVGGTLGKLVTYLPGLIRATASQTAVVDDAAVTDGMKRKCHWIPWC